MAEPIALQFQPPRIDVPQFQFPDTVGTLVKAAQIQHALSQSQHAQAQSGLAQAQTQSYGLKNQQAQDEAKNERLARDAQYVKGFADDPDKYAAAWKGRLDDAVNRGDIPPLMHAQLSQQPPSKELLDSVIQRGAAIPSRLAEAHAGYYEEVAAARRQIAAAVEKNSDTKRLKAYGDVLQKFGPDPPTRDIWDRESQPGGFLHTAFGGRMVPYEQAPQAWREIKSRVAAGPDDQELAEAGLTPEQIRDARRQRVLQGVYGKIEPKTGKRWTPGGALEDIPGAGKDTQNERQSRITARTGKDAADKALAYFEKNQGLGGTLKQMFGDEWEVPMGHQLFKGGLKVGGFGDAGEAMKSSRQAVLELNFALSGKSVSNAEREEFLRLYMPSSMDSFKRQKWKLTQIKSYFDRVLSSKSDDEHGEIVRKAIREAGGSVPEGKNGDRLPPSGRPDPSRMSDDELLRELSRQ